MRRAVVVVAIASVGVLLSGSRRPGRSRRVHAIRGGGAVEAVSLALPSGTDDVGCALIWWGQSLCLGTNGGVALTTSSDNGTVDRLGGSWPLNNAVEGTGTGGTGSNVEFGAVAQGDQIVEHTGWPSTREVVISQACLSGQSYTDIRKGTGTFDNMFDGAGNLKALYDAYDGEGDTLLHCGTVAIHGEADSDEGTTRAVYGGTYLPELEDDIFSDSSAITSQTYEAPLFLKQMASSSKGSELTSQIALSQVDAHEADDHIVLCSAGYHFGVGTTDVYSSDGVHMANQGYLRMGEHLGRCIRAVWDGETWDPLTLQSASVSGTALTVGYLAPPCALNTYDDCDTADIAFDTTSVACPHTGDQGSSCLMGYELLCGSDSVRPPIITGVSLDAANHEVDVTLSAAPATGDCTLGYAVSSIDDANAGAGVSVSGAYGSARGNLRDTTTTVGARSADPVVTWAVTDEASISGGGSAIASVATLLDDIFPRGAPKAWLWVSDATDCPGAASPWVDVIQDYSLPYAAGTWACDQTTPTGLSSAEIGASRIDEAMLNTSGVWATSSGNTAFDRLAGEDILFLWVGTMEVSAGSTRMIHWRGDTATNNEWKVDVLSTSAISTTLNSSGTNHVVNRASILADGQESTMIVYWDSRGGAAGVGTVSICYTNEATNCVTTSAAGAYGSTGTGTFAILGSTGGVIAFAGETTAVGLMIGESARSTVARYGGIDALAQRFDDAY